MHRTPLVAAVVAATVLVGALVRAVVSTAAPAPASPRTAVERRAQLDALGKHLDALRKEAEVDARLALVRVYQRMSSDQLASRQRGVTVYALLDVIKDDTADASVREEAAKAVIGDNATKFDPDLDSTTGKGKNRARAKFSVKLLPLLGDEDVFTRGLADMMLKALWPGVRDNDITGMVVRNKTSCNVAKGAWNRYLDR